MNISQLQYAQKELAEIREFCQANSHLTYVEMHNEIFSRVDQLKGYCRNNNIPIVVNIDAIVDEFCAADDYVEESSYYEEEYYEEEYYEESSYYEEIEEKEEEEEYSSYYEDEEDSSY